MKLQMCLKGTWRDVVTFPAKRAPEVEDAAAMLARAHGKLRLRVLDDDGTARHLNEQGVFRTWGKEAHRG